MFRPRDSFDQRLIDAQIDIHPMPKDFRWVHDVFGNCVAVATFGTKATELTSSANIVLDHTTVGELDFSTDPSALHHPFRYADEERRDLAPTMERQFEDPADEIGKWARRFIDRGPDASTPKLLMTLC